MAIVQTLAGRSEHILDGRRRWALSGRGVLLLLFHGNHHGRNLGSRRDLIHGGRHDWFLGIRCGWDPGVRRGLIHGGGDV
jgi:hypothetical protein